MTPKNASCASILALARYAGIRCQTMIPTRPTRINCQVGDQTSELSIILEGSDHLDGRDAICTISRRVNPLRPASTNNISASRGSSLRFYPKV